ncbi:MAG: MaoC family dehydratase N-terminal domain-containing protein, partial [Actinomycetota bacterium]|nr:MaoC family dehydratase N-terminal domain-containing protein [Actinomycetota bacterium]
MDQSLEGSTGKPFRMVVEEGKIREFARATKSSNPAYLADGQPPATSPVTFLASSVFWQWPESSPWGEAKLNWERLLHGEQEFTFPGPPPAAGTVLTAKSRIDRIYEKEGKRGGTMTFAEVVTEYRDETGAVVAQSRSTAIETSQAPAG